MFEAASRAPGRGVGVTARRPAGKAAPGALAFRSAVGGAPLSIQRQPEPGVCERLKLDTLGPAYRKPESEVKKLGLAEKYVRQPAVGDTDFVLYCLHRSTIPLQRLVACTTLYWIGNAEDQGKGKDQVWAQQEGMGDLYRGYVKRDRIQDTVPAECAPEPEKAKPKPTQSPKFGVHAERAGTTAKYGHAFISLTDEFGTRKEWGFYPACGKCGPLSQCSVPEGIAILGGAPVAGNVCPEVHPKSTNLMESDITPAQHAAGTREVHKWLANPPSYSLLANNCVALVMAVAPLVGVALPDLTMVDEPNDLADEIDRRHIAAGVFRIKSEQGDTIDLTKEKPKFSVLGPPKVHTFKFRWVIADPADNRYRMWSDQGDVMHYKLAQEAYIGDATRAKLRDDGVSEGKVLVRIAPTYAKTSPDSRLIEKAVKFTW